MKAIVLRNRLLLLFHFAFVFLFVGGIASATILVWNTRISDYESAMTSTVSMKLVFDDIVRFGSIGTVIIGVFYGFFTNWGFFRHRWIVAKWIILIAQMTVGIIFVDSSIESNVSLIKQIGQNVLTSAQFIYNFNLLKIALTAELLASILVVIFAIWKPAKNKGPISKATH